MENEGEQNTVNEPKTFTQEELDGVLQSRLGKANAKHEEALKAKEAELAEVRASLSEFEQKIQQKEAQQTTQSEASSALIKRVEALETELAERDARLAAEAQAKIVKGLDDSDSKALLEAGFMPKHIDYVLNQLSQSRIVEGDAAIFKDSDGAAIERSKVIEALVSQNPELVVVNRAAGNNVPTGEAAPKVDRKNESMEQFRARRAAEREEAGIR